MEQSSLLEIGKIFRRMWCFQILSARCYVQYERPYVARAYGFSITATVIVKHIVQS